jgi:hypothetical protein
MIIFEISQSRRCDFFNNWIAQFLTVYVNFSEINITRFVNLSMIDKTQFISSFVFDSSNTKFIIIVWNEIEEECMNWRFFNDLWRLIWICKHCELFLIYALNALIKSRIYHDREIISNVISKSECFCSCSWATTNMFATQSDEIHKRFSFVDLLTW